MTRGAAGPSCASARTARSYGREWVTVHAPSPVTLSDRFGYGSDDAIDTWCL